MFTIIVDFLNVSRQFYFIELTDERLKVGQTVDLCMMDKAYLYKRLKEARQARAEVENRNPTVTFCLACDEIFVDEIAECEVEHEHITEGWDQTEISQWIKCIEYLDRAN